MTPIGVCAQVRVYDGRSGGALRVSHSFLGAQVKTRTVAGVQSAGCEPESVVCPAGGVVLRTQCGCS